MDLLPILLSWGPVRVLVLGVVCVCGNRMILSSVQKQKKTYSLSEECRDWRSCYRVHTPRERLPVGLLYRVLEDEGYFLWAEHSSAVHSIPDHSARCSLSAHSTRCHLGLQCCGQHLSTQLVELKCWVQTFYIQNSDLKCKASAHGTL